MSHTPTLTGTMPSVGVLKGVLRIGCIKGDKGDPGEVTRAEMETYVDERFLAVFGDMNRQINKMDEAIQNKVVVRQWE